MTNAGGDLKVESTAGGVAFRIHVTPRARRAGVGGVRGTALRVAVREPPIEGRANAACVEALAEALGLARRDVELDPRSRGRTKRVHVTGDAAVLATRLRALAETTPLR